MAVGLAVLDDGRIAGPVRREHLAEVLVVPAERGHVLVVAVEDAGLAGAGLRRQVALPAGDLMGAATYPAGQRRHGARRDRPPQDGFGEAVDLQEEHPGHVGRCGRLEAVDHAPHRLALEHGIVVERQHAADDDGRRGHEQRREERRPPAVDDQSVEQLVDRHQDRAVQEEDEQSGRPEEGSGEVAGDDRPDDRVQDRHERSGDERGSPVANGDAGQDPGDEPEAQPADDEFDDIPMNRNSNRLRGLDRWHARRLLVTSGSGTSRQVCAAPAS